MSESQFSRILLDRYQAGDQLAAEEIWTRYASRLRSLARKRLGQSLAVKADPDDILQTSFFEFFEKAKRDEVHWQQNGDLWKLLASIAIHHVARQAERFNAAKRDLSREAHLSDIAFIAKQDQEVSRRMDQLIEPLLSGNSTLASLIAGRLAGKTLAEISIETGKSQRTLRRLLQKAKLALAADSQILTGHELPIASDEFFSARYEDFALLKMVGAGGFGKVYLAHDRINDKFVALKALRRDWIGNATAERLFLNEAATIAGLAHDNIVRFHCGGPLPNGSWFFVLDYVSGSSLNAIDLAHRDSDLVAGWIVQIAKALVYLHDEGVVHGDLKPGNVLVENDAVKLVDFGFSGRGRSESSVWHGGTKEYLAPERQLSTAADVFSFGKVMDFVCRYADNMDDQLKHQLRELSSWACESNPDNRPNSLELSSRIHAWVDPESAC